MCRTIKEQTTISKSNQSRLYTIFLQSENILNHHGTYIITSSSSLNYTLIIKNQFEVNKMWFDLMNAAVHRFIWQPGTLATTSHRLVSGLNTWLIEQDCSVRKTTVKQLKMRLTSLNIQNPYVRIRNVVLAAVEIIGTDTAQRIGVVSVVTQRTRERLMVRKSENNYYFRHKQHIWSFSTSYRIC